MVDTIFAPATAPGKAGVAIVRISGPEALAVLGHLGVSPPSFRRPVLRRLIVDEELLDEAMILAFPEGSSFTGDLVVELHLHGSVAVVDAVSAVIMRSGLARMAKPGEFTRRALLNDRITVDRVQGLGDLIDAETETQRQAAMRVFRGDLTEKVIEWRGDLVRAMALLEAVIDFSEEDVPDHVYPQIRSILGNLVVELEHQLGGVSAARRIREGFEVAIVGPPNAGKSSLINALTKSDAAIVTDIPGTTRDVVAVRMDLDGVLVTFLDTAGIRKTEDVVERIGVERAMERATRADVRIVLGSTENDWPDPVVRVRGRKDLDPSADYSAVTGEGIREILERIGDQLRSETKAGALIVRDREVALVTHAVKGLRALAENMDTLPEEMLAAELQEISGYLYGIVGGVDTEVVLDEIFSSFCIGK